MSNIRIHSIKEKKGSRVEIKYLLAGDPQSYSTSNNVSEQFTNALDDLKPDLLCALELIPQGEGPEFDYSERLRMEEVKLNYKVNDDTESITCQLIARKELLLGDNIKLQSPIRHIERQKEGGVWPTETREKIMRLCNIASMEVRSDSRFREIYSQIELPFEKESVA